MDKKKDLQTIIEKITPSPLDNLMGECYSVYAKDVIQDRAIPDVRDGLKPVQRRIIFDMAKNNIVFNKPTVKCAHIIGDVMGKFHPHGDSSIYEALVRMSQDWKSNCPLAIFQGNNGSIDGDSAAAYRYTEAHLSELAGYLVKDLDKNTVDMTFNFDDTQLEPIVLPARFPNLYVNGASGIAVALATEIPPHNLGEMCEATIYRIRHPNCSIDDLLTIIQGPDFPTGGSIYQSEGLKNIYYTGRGRIEISSKCEIYNDKSGTHILISEIPFGILKKDIVYAIDKIRESGEIDGILEVRDETEMHGVRVVIDIKEGCDANIILQYLYKMTPLLSAYNANIVAIVEGRPKTLSLTDYLDSYIVFQDEIITRRSEYDLAKNKERLHIVEGLIKAISILDDVVKTIRASSNKQEAKTNLSLQFNFSEAQAEAIVNLQLYRLTNTDITQLVSEKEDLEKQINDLESLLTNKKELNNVIVSDLREIASKFSKPRRSIIVEQKEEVSIDKRALIANEEVYVAVTRDGYIKRSSLKSYKSSLTPYPGIKTGDRLVCADLANTVDYLLCFTNLGNYLFLPINEIQDGKWKEEGKHVNYICQLPIDERIIKAIIVQKFNEDVFIASISSKGQIKKTRLSEFFAQRYSKPISMMRLSSSDELVDVCVTNGNNNLLIINNDGRATFFNENELQPLGLKTSGIKSISNIKDSKVASLITLEQGEKGKIAILTDKGHVRIFDLSNLELTQRLGKINILMKSFKSSPHKIIYVSKIDKNSESVSLKCLDLLGQVNDIKIDDYHVTPIEKYAKNNTNIADDTILTECYVVNVQHVTSDMKTYKIETPKDDNGGDEEDGSKTDHEQISMFDLNGD